MTTAKCSTLRSFWITVPVGSMLLEVCSNGVHSLRFCKITSLDFDHLLNAPTVHFDHRSGTPDDADSVEAVTLRWLQAYFSRSYHRIATAKLPPICTLRRMSGFTLKVIQHLRLIRFGRKTSYGELAKRCGHQGAARAVGQVLGKNRVMLMIPCHRVVPKAGGHGHFGGGKLDDVKKLLLTYESYTYSKKNMFSRT